MDAAAISSKAKPASGRQETISLEPNAHQSVLLSPLALSLPPAVIYHEVNALAVVGGAVVGGVFAAVAADDAATAKATGVNPLRCRRRWPRRHR